MIGIRREDKNTWERRAPLTPDQVSGLIRREGLKFSVQPSPVRAFPVGDYLAAGARVNEDLSDCSLVLGIKEIPAEKLDAGAAYLFFSHTTKGQSRNMPMLRRILELRGTLLDYEQIADDQDRRLIYFGRHAGYAGMIDALWVLGRRLALDGVSTPLEEIGPAHTYTSLAKAIVEISRVGDRIREEGLPDAIHPLVCGITGTGNVSLGAQEIVDRLPVEEVSARDLAALSTNDAAPRNVIYKVIFDLPERFERIGGGEVTLQELSKHPERFTNGMLRWLPHVSLLVNGMFWMPTLPRLLPLDDMRRMWKAGELSRLRVIVDIACDIDGAIEATVKATTPDDPVFVYEVSGERVIDGFEGDGPVILAVDNLPAELPRESSRDFGDTLSPFVAPLGRCDWNRPLDRLGLPPELSRAILVHRGALTPRFSHLEKFLG